MNSIDRFMLLHGAIAKNAMLFRRLNKDDVAMYPKHQAIIVRSMILL